VFRGYPFDTIGTRLGRPNLDIPLGVLGQYRNVVWITDAKGATFRRSGQDWQQPQTSLYYMSSENRVNSLGSYVGQGGNVWVLGGGGAMASTYPHNVTTNDQIPITFSSATGELKDGRFMYTTAGWRSEIHVGSVQPQQVARYLGRLEQTGSVYDALPAKLAFKTPASDPLSIWAPGRKANDFYVTGADVEYLQKPDDVLDDDVPPASLLDTLYHADAPTMPNDATNPYNVVMSVYHPTAGHTVVFTGFAPWVFQRSQFVAMTDVVLGGLWGLSRSAPPPPASPALVQARARVRPGRR
jgi:hypothetical protein